jgi:hypothetical protein
MTAKPFNYSILSVIYNFMDFHISCCSAVRNKNFEWTALSGISTIIGSYNDVHLLLSVFLYSVKIVQDVQNRSEPVHSVRCLARTLSMDSVVLIQNSYGSYSIMLSRKQSP